jgi:hypothetical protein
MLLEHLQLEARTQRRFPVCDSLTVVGERSSIARVLFDRHIIRSAVMPLPDGLC